jgi:hypothetical protein
LLLQAIRFCPTLAPRPELIVEDHQDCRAESARKREVRCRVVDWLVGQANNGHTTPDANCRG